MVVRVVVAWAQVTAVTVALAMVEAVLAVVAAEGEAGLVVEASATEKDALDWVVGMQVGTEGARCLVGMELVVELGGYTASTR